VSPYSQRLRLDHVRLQYQNHVDWHTCKFFQALHRRLQVGFAIHTAY